MTNFQSLTIILIEDDPGHALLIKRNLRRAHIRNHIVTLKDGEEALTYFFGEESDANRSAHAPVLVLLDLNLPIVDGYQVLRHIKNDARTKSIPVVILTTTDDPREVAACYELGCNVYITKPVEYLQFCDAIRQLGLFLSVVTVPQIE